MSEADFKLMEVIISGIRIFLYGLCISAFFHFFMAKENGKYRLQKCFIVFLSYIGVYFMGWTLSGYGWVLMLLVTGLLMAFAGFFGMDRRQIFFLAAIFYCVKTLSALITVTSIELFFGNFLSEGTEKAGYTDNILLSAVFRYIAAEVMEFLFFVIMLYIAGRQLKKKSFGLHFREFCYLLVIPAAGILFGNMIARLLVTVKEQVVFQLYEQFPVFLAIVPLIAVLFYAGMLITIASCQKMVGLQEERKKYFVKEQQIRALQERMEEVEQFYGSIRQMKHEMRNHMTNIRGLAQSGCYKEMNQYISQMDESMKVFDFSIKTGNAVTDVILNDKQKVAVKQGIRFQSEFYYPGSDKYNAYDIGIIVHNLLQNALEACEKMKGEERYIFISGRQRKKFFLIEVKNSFEGQIVFDETSNLPVSTKENRGHGKAGFLHGIGLSNVRQEAEKYMGDIEIRAEKNEFCVIVLLQERRQK